jgi:2-oxoglutarate ferredoxin oxidoreductase subunit alpha
MYTEDSAEYQEVVDRLLVKWETARNMVPGPEIEYSKFNSTAISSVGSCDGAINEALVQLKEKNIGLNYCRVKSFPFNDDVKDFIDKHERVYVVEQNRDAQLRALMILDAEADPKKIVSMLHYDGMPMNADFVVEKVEEEVAKGRAA